MLSSIIFFQEEELLKRVVWEENVKKIELHNRENSLGKNTYIMEINNFADLVSVTWVASHCIFLSALQ